MAIICIVFRVLYGSLLNKQHRAENPGDIHGTYRLKGNASPETEYITFDINKKIIIYYGIKNGKKPDLKKKAHTKEMGHQMDMNLILSSEIG